MRALRGRAIATPLTVLLACAPVLHSGVARAGEPPPEAKQAFADGKQAYERGDFEGALRLFQRADSIAPAPSLNYNIGMTLERLGRYDEAGGSFDRYLAQAPQPRDDQERQFQDNLRARSAADHERGKRAVQTEPPPQPLVEPPPQPPAYAPYPYYGYAPYGYAPAPVAQMPRAQRILLARRHRNNGIALIAVGGALIIGGAALTGWVVGLDPNTRGGEVIAGAFGASIGYIVGLTLLIPGAVATGKWQAQLKRELRSPEDGAATRRAALDLAAPPKAMSNTTTFALSLPAIRF